MANLILKFILNKTQNLMRKLFLLLPFAALLSFAACETDGDRTDYDGDRDTVLQDADTTAAARQREEYRVEMERDVTTLEARLDSLDKRMENATGKAREEWRETRANLRQRLDRARQDLNELGTKADSEWDQFRARVRANLDSLRAEWDSADVNIEADVRKK